jgi:hypothetical protein
MGDYTEPLANKNDYRVTSTDNDFLATYQVFTLFSVAGTFKDFFKARLITNLVITGNDLLNIDYSVISDELAKAAVEGEIDNVFTPKAISDIEPLYFAPET